LLFVDCCLLFVDCCLLWVVGGGLIWQDTIAAISSAVGAAARMIVRTSGAEAIALARQLGVALDMESGAAIRCKLAFSDLSCPAWVYVFRAPGSYTGEDLVEFHLPGSPVLAKMLLGELLHAGARTAEPGEFTARAYFNGRIDLTGAEAVAAIIGAGSELELAAARRLMAGELARRLAPAIDLITHTLALVEAGIDFSEEDISFLAADEIAAQVHGADDSLARLLTESARFERLAHEPRMVLVGRPNSGKSTLLNALAGRARAIVSPVAGTTRDALSAEIVLPRGIVQLIDVAGIEESAAQQSGSREIDRQMQRHALQTVEEADVVVLVEEIAETRPRLRLTRQPAMIIRTKLDLLTGVAPEPHGGEALISAVTGAGMDQLKQQLDAICFGETLSGATLALNVRHVQAIADARAALQRISQPLKAARSELIALELREALDALGGILGRVTPDDVLGRIFSGFCIGK
jgi:tRNA modification GTPase